MNYYLVRIRGTQGVDVFTSTQEYELNTDVVVISDNGVDLGRIHRDMPPMEAIGEIQGKASEKDIDNYWKNIEKAKEAKDVCEARIKELDLSMELMSVHYNLDQSKVFIDYLSEVRIDFRDLLKELSKDLQTRIELKQLGARDRAQKIGGLGVCGRQACCMHKKAFDSITIAMAKTQMIPINNDKLAGVCGKLKCCLAYENDVYLACRERFPRLNSKVVFKDVEYKVIEINCISEKLLLSNRQGRFYVTLEEYNEMGHQS